MYSAGSLLSFQLALSFKVVEAKPSSVSLEEWLKTIRKSLLSGLRSDSDAVKLIGKNFPQVDAISERLETDDASSPWRLPQLARAMLQLQQQQRLPRVGVLHLTRVIVKTACLCKSSVSRFIQTRISNEHKSSQKLMDSIRRDLSKLLNVVGRVLTLLFSAFSKLETLRSIGESSDSTDSCPATYGIAGLFDIMLDLLHEISIMLARQIQRIGAGSDLVGDKAKAIPDFPTVSHMKRMEGKSKDHEDLKSVSQKLVLMWVKVFSTPFSVVLVNLKSVSSTTTSPETAAQEHLRLCLLGSLLLRCGRLINCLTLRAFSEQALASQTTADHTDGRRLRKSKPKKDAKGTQNSTSKNPEEPTEGKEDENFSRLAGQIEGCMLIPLLRLLQYEAPQSEEASAAITTESSQFYQRRRTFQRTLIDGIFGSGNVRDGLSGARLTDYLRKQPKAYEQMVREAETLINDDDFSLDATDELCNIPFVDRMWHMCGWDILEENWDQAAEFVTLNDTNGESLQEDIETEDEEL